MVVQKKHRNKKTPVIYMSLLFAGNPAWDSIFFLKFHVHAVFYFY